MTSALQPHLEVRRKAEIFAHRLEQFADAVAIVVDGGEALSYADLARRADAFAERLGPARRLVLIEAANTLEPLIAYLGCLRAGHPVILVAAGGDHDRLASAFRPDARFAAREGAWTLDLTATVGAASHADLAVLLSTSGTTGATKLVRLAAGAVEANAQSIVTYLGLEPADRAVTALPFHYSYGLSVVNSHLAVGATILLTERSVVDPAFWAFFEAQRGTSLSGVPHTYDLLERAGFRDRAPASLKTLTQAGGRLPPDSVSRMAAWAEARGVRFFVMYGQTEATARMAYLPPEHALAHPGAIGVAIPGGEFRLIDADGALIDRPDTVGELVYRGPNVMMGYATERDDLARGPELTELRTGDLASRDAAGLYRIAGRKSRFAKIFGLRVSLDEVEAKLAEFGVKGAAVSDDVRIYAAVVGQSGPSDIPARLAAEYKLPASIFQITRLDDLPTLPSGKVDYQTILRTGQASAEAAAAVDASRHPIEAAFVHAFPGAPLTPTDSFISLGGDSLNYVALSIEIERALGFLPEDWERLTLQQLTGLMARKRPARWWSLRTIETEVVLRMLAILAVVVNHASSLPVGGGAEVLLILAGYSLGRYQKARLAAGQGLTVAWSFTRRIIAPYYLLLIAYLIAVRSFDVPSLLLASNFFGRFGSLMEPFWFLEAMFQGLVIVALLSLVPPVRKAIATDPWRFGLVSLAAALALKCGAYAVFHHDHLANRTPDAILPLMALGWCVNEATTRARRLVMTALLAGLAALEIIGVPDLWPAYAYPTNASHAVWLGLCAAGLLWVRRIPLPLLLHVAVGAIAGASFYIYLTHVVPLWLIYWVLGVKNLALNLTVAVIVGLSAWWMAGRLAELWSRRRIAERP